MNGRQGLTVAINAQIVPWRNGGVAHALIALIRTLGQLQDGEETYRIAVASDEQFSFWKSAVGPNQEIVLKTEYDEKMMRERSRRKSFPEVVKRPLRPLLSYVRSLLSLNDQQRNWPNVSISDGFYESLGCDVLHFPWQHFVVCALPSIFNPHDVQHLHYPQFFSAEEIAWRETVYPAGCRFAQRIVVGSQWAKRDLVRQYRLHPAKVQVIPEGPPTQLLEKPGGSVLRQVKEKYRLPDVFMLYPAITWPHKNHIRLIEALAYLRDAQGLVVSLVCVGSPHEKFWPRIEKRILELRLGDQIKCLGFVPELDLRAIYGLTQCLVFPSLFEASSLPIFEAWLEGVPVMCSNTTALPGQVLDAALLFDPNNVESIANAIARMATDSDLRRELRTRGYGRVGDFSWERTAKAYRAAYRSAAGFPLTEEDRWLLKWDWMQEPKRTMGNCL